MNALFVFLQFIFTLLYLIEVVHVLNNGLALTPPMGWMSWGYYMCAVKCKQNPNKCLNEDLIMAVADEFYENGYQEAGYQYIIIDDCWSEKERDEHGRLVADRKRFPRGMKFLADYIHKRGLKFGMYSNPGETTCMQYPGSREYLKLDAETFARWGADYVKFDGCFVEEDYLNKVYIEFGKYLNETGRPIVYSCSWPYYIEFIYKHKPDFDAVAKYCNLWRNFHDVFDNWPNVEYIIRYFETNHEDMAKYMGPGRWNDPDMLVVGTGTLTLGQARIQMSVYAMLSAPLLISCDMKNITIDERQILLNQDLISVAQDPLGIQGVPYKFPKSRLTLWVKRHLPMKGDQYHSFSFAFVNMGNNLERYSVLPGDYGLNSMDGYSVMDVFSKRFLANITLQDSIEVVVPSYDVVFYTLFPL